MIRSLDSRGSSRSSRARSRNTGSSLLREDALASVDTAVLGKVQVEGAVVPLAGEEQEGEGESGDHEEVEDAEEDEALCHADLVAAVGHTEGDGVQQPEEVEPAREHEVVPVQVQATG